MKKLSLQINILIIILTILILSACRNSRDNTTNAETSVHEGKIMIQSSPDYSDSLSKSQITITDTAVSVGNSTQSDNTNPDKDHFTAPHHDAPDQAKIDSIKAEKNKNKK